MAKKTAPRQQGIGLEGASVIGVACVFPWPFFKGVRISSIHTTEFICSRHISTSYDPHHMLHTEDFCSALLGCFAGVISLIAKDEHRVLMVVIKESHSFVTAGGVGAGASGCAPGCAIGCARAARPGPCRGSWHWIHPESHFEWPLSRIVALDPSGEP